MFFKIVEEKIIEASREEFLEFMNSGIYCIGSALAGGYASLVNGGTSIVYIDTNDSELEDKKVAATLDYLRRCD